MHMFIEERVHTRFDTSDLTEWIIGKTGDDKIHLSHYDKYRTRLDIGCIQSIYPEVCTSTNSGYDYWIECPGIVVFTKLSDSITSFVSKYQFSDKGLQCVMQSNCIVSHFKEVLDHLEVHNGVNVYYQDGIYLVFVDTTSLIRDFLHDKYPKDNANAFNDQFDLKFSPHTFGDCIFSASWIVSNDND
jgi:hypothetical protein